MAVQFMLTSCDTAHFDRRPKNNPSVEELHHYALTTQIKDTAKIGRDAGVGLLCSNHVAMP